MINWASDIPKITFSIIVFTCCLSKTTKKKQTKGQMNSSALAFLITRYDVPYFSLFRHSLSPSFSSLSLYPLHLVVPPTKPIDILQLNNPFRKKYRFAPTIVNTGWEVRTFTYMHALKPVHRFVFILRVAKKTMSNSLELRFFIIITMSSLCFFAPCCYQSYRVLHFAIH